MSRLLNDLAPEFRIKAFELIARCAERGIPVMIVDTLRTPAEQEMNISKGVSWTMHSKHLPNVINHLAYAIDIAPYDQFLLYGPDKLKWDSKDPVWQSIGVIGETLDLIWGGRWKQKDMGHFEFKFASTIIA